MREMQGNLFTSVHSAIVIPTNGVLRIDGRAVMGAGVALEVSIRWPWLPPALGARIAERGPMVEWFPIEPDQVVVAFPTKRHFRDAADLDLIETSAIDLSVEATCQGWESVALPRVGCGLGGLRWDDVRGRLARILDDRFVVVAP